MQTNTNEKLQVVTDDGDMIILFDRRDGSYRLGFRSLSMHKVMRFADQAALLRYMTQA